MSHRLGKTTIVASLLALSASLCGTAQAQAAGQWYLSPSIGSVNPDTARGSDGNGFFGGFGVGRTFTSQVSGEMRLFFTSLEGENLNPDTDMRGLTVDALFYPVGRVGSDRRAAPFFLAGLGVIHNKIGEDYSGSDPAVNLGLGLNVRMIDGALAFRGEARYLMDFINSDFQNSYGDWQASVGVNIMLSRAGETAVAAADRGQTQQRDPSLRDSDNDGVSDAADRCPYTAPTSPVDKTGCVVASEPLVTEPAVTATGFAQPVASVPAIRPAPVAKPRQDAPARPAAPAAATVAVAAAEPEPTLLDDNALAEISFTPGTSELDQSAKPALIRLARALRDQPETRLEISGHTDWDGNAAENLTLSQERADAVREQLVLMGVRPEQLSARGYGDSKPIADNNTAAGRARNRRIEFRLVQN